ncbi:hypothetical protein HpDR15_13340 [Helicobacter pylori]
MSGCKMSRVSRELFDNIKSFLHYKLKTMIRIQSVNDLELILKWQDRVLECQSFIALKELNHKLYNQGVRHTIMMQGLFLFFEYFDTSLIKGRKQHLSNYAKAYIALNLLWTIRNRAYHWENLLKLRANNRLRITTRFIRELEKPTSKSFNFSIMPNKIVSFLDDLIKSIGNKDLEKLSSL